MVQILEDLSYNIGKALKKEKRWALEGQRNTKKTCIMTEITILRRWYSSLSQDSLELKKEILGIK